MANPRQEETNAVQSAERTTRKIAEETNRASRHMTDFCERAVRANVEMLAGQAETVQQMWQSGSKLASQLTARSADQFTRAFGIAGDEPQDGTQQTSRNLVAIVQSSTVLTRGFGAISTEWFELMRKRIEYSLDQMDTLLRCRTPQSLATAQSDAMRENLEGVIISAHRIAEISLRAADEASRKVTENIEQVRRAA
jgi:Phasin protein